MTSVSVLVFFVLFFSNVSKSEEQFKFYENDPFLGTVLVSGGQTDILEEITLDEVRSSVLVAQILAQQEQEYDEWLPQRGIRLNRNSSGYFRTGCRVPPKPLPNMKRASDIMIKALEILLESNKKSHGLPPKILMKLFYKKKFRLSGVCEKFSNTTVCSKYKDSKYRTFSGLCNNFQKPSWGMALSTFSRLIPANYEDGIYKPAISVLGQNLPSARKISVRIFESNLEFDSRLTLLASEFAQIIAHDTNQAIVNNVEGGPIMCCTDRGSNLPEHLRHHSCLPIPVPKNDPLFSRHKRTCMQFVRSLTAPKMDCVFSAAEQINAVTSYLDCSFLYGNSLKLVTTLRTFYSGQLLEDSTIAERMLPKANLSDCDDRSKYDICYKSGDTRVNQNPHLVALQVVFLREHNRIATELQELNPHWNDEKLFQETRRILVAVYQHIIYKEYLPLMLGESFIKTLFSDSNEDGFTGCYDSRVNAGTLNSMNIIFRCYHSTIPNKIRAYSDKCHVISEHNFSDFYLRPVLCTRNLDEILNSFSCSSMTKMDACVTSEITNKLFKSRSKYGLDLLAMDIQRGRDHGIPGYNTFRELLGFKRASSFNELIPDLGKKNVQRLESCYQHVEDIDLLVGGMLENPISGLPFGPVILAILREQFYRFMVGDRYFYTNKEQPYPFTPAQMEQIRQANIAKLICNNGNNIRRIQKNAFQTKSERNSRVKCSMIPSVDLQPWKEYL